MENLDTALEQRVWQRVRPSEEVLALQPLVAAEQSLAATYRMLMGMLQGQERLMLRRLFETERRHGQMLSGMYLLTEGKPLSVRTVPLKADRPETALRKCYGQTLRAMRVYEGQQQDPEHGHVFRFLAQQEEEQARMLLEILGSLQR